MLNKISGPEGVGTIRYSPRIHLAQSKLYVKTCESHRIHTPNYLLRSSLGFEIRDFLHRFFPTLFPSWGEIQFHV